MFSVFGIFIIATLCVKNSQAQTFKPVVASAKDNKGACRFNLGLRNRDADTADAKPKTSQTADSFFKCEELCTKAAGCKAIGYDLKKKACILHNAVPTHVAATADEVYCAVNPASKRPSVPVTSYELANPTVPQGCCRFDQGAKRPNDSSSGARTDSSVVVDSIAKCQEACDKKDDCFAIEYETAKKNCKLFGAAPTHVEAGKSDCVCAINPSRSPVVPFSAFVAEASAWDAKRSRWISGNIFAPVFSIIEPTKSGIKSSVKKLPDTVKGTVGVYILKDVVYAVGLDPTIMMGKKVKTVQLIKWNMASSDAPTVVDLSSLVSGVTVAMLNDLVVTSNGDAYLTDSSNGLIYKVDKDNKVSAYISKKPESWKGGSFGGLTLIANGIETFTGTDGKQYLLVGLSFQGTKSLSRVDIATKAVTTVDVKGEEWKAMPGIDGLRFQPVVINVKAPWEVVTSVLKGGCTCDCCTTTAYVSWHQTESRIRSSWFERTKCNGKDAGSRKAAYVANVSPSSAPGKKVEFQIAYDGDYDNIEKKDFKITCTLTADGSVKCPLTTDGKCEDVFTGRTPRNFLGAVAGNGVYVLNSQDDYKTATVLGLDRRPALGGKSRNPTQTTLTVRDSHLIALSTSFAGAGTAYERKVELASTWAAANKAIPSGCCRFKGLETNAKWSGSASDKSVFASSISACQDACAKSAGCYAIEYVIDKFKCELHGSPSHVEYIPTARCVCAINPKPLPTPAPASTTAPTPVSGSPSTNLFFICSMAVAHFVLLLM